MPTRNRPSLTQWLQARLLLGLLLLSLIARGAIPAGYMPDADALKQGRIEISLCVAGHATTVPMWLEADTPKTDLPGNDAAADPCPYWLHAHQQAALPATATVPALPAPRALPLPVSPTFLALAAHGPTGPPLGSRAPPQA